MNGKYDDRDNLIYYEESDGTWYKRKYDENDNLLHYEDSNNNWSKLKYDSNNNEICCKFLNGD